MTKLSAELSRLVDAHVLSPAQSQDLEAAARADLLDALEASRRPAPMPRESSRSTVLEVLGYAGGALLLGAVIFLGFSFWDELERPARIGVALASFAGPRRRRRGPGGLEDPSRARPGSAGVGLLSPRASPGR